MAKEKVTILHRWFEEVCKYPWSVPDCLQFRFGSINVEQSARTVLPRGPLEN